MDYKIYINGSIEKTSVKPDGYDEMIEGINKNSIQLLAQELVMLNSKTDLVNQAKDLGIKSSGKEYEVALRIAKKQIIGVI